MIILSNTKRTFPRGRMAFVFRKTWHDRVSASLGSSLGLFLIKQFMETVSNPMLEAAKIDGVGEVWIFFKIVMPSVKPAWLTLIIFSFQAQ